MTPPRLRLIGVLSFALAVSAPPALARKQWTLIDNPSNGGSFSAIRHTPLGWVAVGSSSLIRISRDGKVWRDPMRRTLFPSGIRNEWIYGTTLDQTIPRGNAFQGIASLGPTVAIAGSRGLVLSTTDGETWTAADLGDSLNFTDIAASEDAFVAVGSKGAVFRSADGRTWDRMAFPSQDDLWQVIRARGEFLAIGQRGGLYSSPDGIAWADRSIDSVRFLEVSANSHGYLARFTKSTDSLYYPQNGFLARSNDARKWNFDTAHFEGRAITRSQSIFSDDTAWYVYGTMEPWSSLDPLPVLSSTDGLTWVNDSMISHLRFSKLAFGGKLFARKDGIWIAPDNDGGTMLGCSRDLRSWQVASPKSFDAIYGAMHWNADGWWASTSTGYYVFALAALYHSRDLLHWDAAPLRFGIPYHFEECFGRQILWGSSYLGTVDFETHTTTDGEDSARKPPWRTSQNAVACGDGKMLLLTGTSCSGTGCGKITLWNTPQDTIQNTSREIVGTRTVRWLSTLRRWVALGFNSDTRRAWSSWSSDGLEWHTTLRTWPTIIDMGTDGSTLVAVGIQGTVIRSQDGVNWDSISLGTKTDLSLVKWSDSVFIVTGFNGIVAVSRDGLSWDLDSVPIPNGKATYGATMHADTLLVGGENGYLYFTTGALNLPPVSATRREPAFHGSVRRTGSAILVGIDGASPGPWILYDVSGRQRQQGKRLAGSNEVAFDARLLGHGVFVFRDGRSVRNLLVP